MDRMSKVKKKEIKKEEKLRGKIEKKLNTKSFEKNKKSLIDKKNIVYLLFFLLIMYLIFIFVFKILAVNSLEKSIDTYLKKDNFEYILKQNIFEEYSDVEGCITDKKDIKRYFDLYKISTDSKDIYLDKNGSGILVDKTKTDVNKEYINKENSKDYAKYYDLINIYNPFKNFNLLKKANVKVLRGKKYLKALEKEKDKILKNYPTINISELKDNKRFEMLKYKNIFVLRFKNSLPIIVLEENLKNVADTKEENKTNMENKIGKNKKEKKETKEIDKEKNGKNKNKEEFKSLDEKIKKNNNSMYYIEYIRNKTDDEMKINLPY